MEKRFVTFVAFALLLLLGYNYLLTRVIFPPAPPAAPVAAAPGAKPEEIVDRSLPPAPEQRVTLGSLDVASPYKMLVTLTARGAAVERVELNAPRFAEMDDVSDPQRLGGGYLGSLSLVRHPGPGTTGARVRVVGPGTPAAAAGLKPGDVITTIHGQKVEGPAMAQSVLNALRPGMTVKVAWFRDGKELQADVALVRPPLQILQTDGRPPADGVEDYSLLLTFDQIGGRTLGRSDLELPGYKLREQDWEYAPGADPQQEAVFTAKPKDLGLEIVKRYRLERVTVDPAQPERNRVGYAIKVQIELRNVGQEPHTVAYRLDGPKGLPTEGYWFPYKLAGHGMRDVVLGFAGYSDPEFYGAQQVTHQKEPFRWVIDPQQRPLKFAGVDTPLFASVLMPEAPPAGVAPVQWVQAVSAGKPRTDNAYLNNSTIQVGSRSVTLAPGAAQVDVYDLFVGPKAHYEILPAYGLDGLIQYGWFPWVVKPLIYMMDWLYGWVGNYGIAIILLTVIVRLVLFPFTRRIALSMQTFQIKMQKVKPEMDRLKEVYKNNPQEQLKAQQELFRKHDINPGVMAGGCLGAFAQIPIFIGLLNALRIDIELRQAPLFTESFGWCTNLAAPDMFWYWQPYLPEFLAGPNGWFGPYLNLLPILSTCLFLFHQHMSMPPAQDEQQQAQQTMMQIMTVMFTVFFFRIPCGACLYFITSTLWGMMERATLPKMDPNKVDLTPAPKKAPADLEENSAVAMVKKWLGADAAPAEGSTSLPPTASNGNAPSTSAATNAAERRKERKRKERDRR